MSPYRLRKNDTVIKNQLYFVLIKYSNRSPRQRQEDDIDVCGQETLGADTVPAEGSDSSTWLGIKGN